MEKDKPIKLVITCFTGETVSVSLSEGQLEMLLESIERSQMQEILDMIGEEEPGAQEAEGEPDEIERYFFND